MFDYSNKYRKVGNVEFIKLGNDRNLVKLSSVYDNNCSEQEYQEVNDATLDFIIKNEREMASKDRYYRKKTRPLPERNDEIKAAGMVSPSAEDCYMHNYNDEEIQEILDIFSSLTDCQRRRIELLFSQGHTYKQVSEDEGVAIGSVESSITIALEKLRPYRHILQDTDISDWLNYII